jgi:NADPH oxidase 2
VYFIWVIRDFAIAEWFHSLLQAIEEQDTQNRIEITIYLTAKIQEDDVNNIIVRLTFALGTLMLTFCRFKM